MASPVTTWIEENVNGRTFADVGGLWGTVNEKVSIAHRHGSACLTMIDITPLDHNLWKLFNDRMRELAIPDVHCISADIRDFATSESRQQFDVVHCAGVLYHLPNPMQLLAALHAITNEHLILASCVTATVVENAAGRLEIPPAAALFLPALRDDEMAIIRADWVTFVGDHAAGLTRDTHWDSQNFGPWWWLPTSECLKAMCSSAGFNVIDEHPAWSGRSHVLLLSKRRPPGVISDNA